MIEAVEFNQWAVTSRARALSPSQRVHQPSISDQVHISAQGRVARTAGPSDSTAGAQALSMEEKREVDKLKAQDQQVKTHEKTHMASGGDLVVGGANYTYQRGPDGKMSTLHLDRLYQHPGRAFAVESEFAGGTGT
jgi:hypothetical protein